MRLYQSLFILHNHLDTINYLSELMLDYRLEMIDPATADEKTLHHYLALHKTSVMEACSFLEEYQDNFEQLSEPEFKERIRFIKTALRPVTRRIAEWKDLRKIRNELLAHPWRGKGESFIYGNIFTYNSPRNFWQLQELRTYLSVIDAVISAEFGLEGQEIPDYMASIAPTPIPPANNLNIIEEINGIIEQVNCYCTRHHAGFRINPSEFTGV